MLNVCGQPNAAAPPNCLTPTEADVIDIVLDGPRNDLGQAGLVPVGPRHARQPGSAFERSGRKRGLRVGQQGSRLRLADGPRTDWDDLVQLSTNTLADHTDTATPDTGRREGQRREDPDVAGIGGRAGPVPVEHLLLQQSARLLRRAQRTCVRGSGISWHPAWRIAAAASARNHRICSPH